MEIKASPGSGLNKFDVAYFTASCDDAATNTRYAKALKLDYAILSDPDKKTAKAFGVLSARGFPSRWTYYIGKDGKIQYIDKEVKAATHAEAIKSKLRELGVSER